MSTPTATDQLALFDQADHSTPQPPPTPGRPDTWLLTHLITNGYVTEHGISRTARIRTCSTCHHHVLVGLDGDTCAFDTTVDPQPLTPLGEALAHLEGRHTYALHRQHNGYVLDPRDSFQITGRPAATRPREDILRTHHCDTGPPSPALTAPTTYAEHTPRPPSGSAPPF